MSAYDDDDARWAGALARVTVGHEITVHLLRSGERRTLCGDSGEFITAPKDSRVTCLECEEIEDPS